MFDAIVIAVAPSSTETILGLTLVERGRRMVAKAGARRVFVLDATSGESLTPWAAEIGGADLLVVRAGDQVVHFPLVKPLLAATGSERLAIGPDGAFAGALYVTSARVDEVVAALTASPATADRDLAARFTVATNVPHGDIAVHAATTKAERKGATRMLLRLLIKQTEDSPVSKYVYRPLSRPLTRLLLRTPITANQVSYITGIVGLLGCVLTAFASQTMLIWGAAFVFLSGVIDGCDGEISRMKLTSSPFGAWLDTIIDEVTQVTYFFAIGCHTYQHFPMKWVGASIFLGGVSFLATIYAIYFFSLVVIKQGGSQYYETDIELVDIDGTPVLRPRPKVSTTPPWLAAIAQFFLYMIRRDFINLAALFIALFNGYAVIYGGIWFGTIVAALITIPAHVKLLSLIRQVRAKGAALRYLAS
ncbi:hypothetical protein BH11MYX2_BH11MYX2_33370 [soil metagenome]